MGETEIRCRSCHQRFKSATFQELIECPHCHQRWKLKWFDETTATILAPDSWVQFQKKMKEVKK